MARIIHHDTLTALPSTQPLDLGRALFVLTQLVILGGIGVFLAFALLNTILGVPQSDPSYQPYR